MTEPNYCDGNGLCVKRTAGATSTEITAALAASERNYIAAKHTISTLVDQNNRLKAALDEAAEACQHTLTHGSDMTGGERRQVQLIAGYIRSAHRKALSHEH